MRSPRQRRWLPACLAALVVLPLAATASAAAQSTTYVETVDFVTPQVGYAVVARSSQESAAPRLYRTLDAGAHWAAVPGGLPTQSPHPFFGADVVFMNEAHGMALMSLGAGACQEGWQVYRTADGGRSWQVAGEILGEDGPIVLAVAPKAPPWFLNGSCAGAYAELLRNSGKQWPLAHEFALPAAAAKRYFNPSAVSLQRYGAKGALVVDAYYPAQSGAHPPLLLGYRTADDGATWQPLALGNQGLAARVSAIAFYNTSEGLAATRSAAGRLTLYVTHDGGRHWLPVHGVSMPERDYQLSIQWRTIQWLNAKVADVLVDKSLWRTTNGGTTWRVVTSKWPE